MQVGTAVDLTDNAVQVFERIEGNSDRLQEFTTVGIFQRIGALNWAVVYDYLDESYYDHFNLGQVRAKVGYHITECDEIGAWGTIATEKDNGTFGAIPLTLRPIDQASAFWRHTWENCSNHGLGRRLPRTRTGERGSWRLAPRRPARRFRG